MQAGHPSEDVGITAQLGQPLNVRVIGGEIREEVTYRTAVVTSSVWAERGTERNNGTLEDRSQRMLQWGMSLEAHEALLGRGRIHWVTARAY
jgi:hypothetical protein